MNIEAFFMKNLFVFLFACVLHINSTSQCYLKSQPDWGHQLSSTGSKKLDELLINEFKTMSVVFDINNYLGIYEGNNAFAIRNSPWIMIGKSLMLDEFVKTNGSKSIIAIMAHEFGHCLQYKYNMEVDGSWGGKWCELHADYMAGWFMGMKQYFSNDKLSQEEFNKVVESFFELGDTDYYDPNHHGTKQERSTAFLGGFYAATSKQFDLNTSYFEGQKYVINIDKNVNEFYPETKNNSSNSYNNTNSTTVGYLCLYGISKKALKTEIFIGDQYLGNLTVLYKNGSVTYGDGGTISIPLNPGNYQLYLKSTFGLFDRNTNISVRYINISGNKITLLPVGDE